MSGPAYRVAANVAGRIHEHLRQHREAVAGPVDLALAAPLPDLATITAMIDTAFWTSLRREEGTLPRISLALVPPVPEVHPLRFATAMPMDPSSLGKLAPAVERPGIHLGAWPVNGRLMVWGTARVVPPLCFIVETVAPGLLVLKHRPWSQASKFVNVAVLEGDRIKVIDERVSMTADCPPLLEALLRFDARRSAFSGDNCMVQLAVSMRRHGRGGTLIVVPADSDAWRQSVLQPIAYTVTPSFDELAELMQQPADDSDWLERVDRAVDAIAGLTTVDGATIITDRYEVLAFAAKLGRRKGADHVSRIVMTEPIEGNVAIAADPSQVGGTRHVSAAQFVSDQPDALALVASQDGRFTVFAWSPSTGHVYAHRVDALLM